MSKTFSHYSPDDKMRDIIADNNLLLMALSRFNIPLGFADASISEVCAANSVDCDTFLTVANFISGKTYQSTRIQLTSLMGYLKRAHTYFLDFILPTIRRKLIEAINCADNSDAAFLILKFYDDYVNEVSRHMGYENDTVFTYVDKLLNGESDSGFRIATFIANHKPIATKLKELKEIFIGHYSMKGNGADMLNSVLYDIIVCEHDLMMHCAVEDRLFVPAVEALEQDAESGRTSDQRPTADAPAEGCELDGLTEREKEIIRCVARGMANKEIADSLCLSVHTVTTHRRNISAKLQIHSTAGLAIFAIIHRLISLTEVRP